MASVTVGWTTDIGATSWVEYGPTTAYGSSSGLIDPALVTTHSIVLNGLSAGTTYHYRIHSRNPAGTDTTTSDATFLIPGTSIGPTTATITWTTDVPGTTWVEYGTTTSYGSNSGLIDPALVTSHSVVLTGLSPNTTYHYRAHSRNAAGTETITPDATFTTTSTGTTSTTFILITVT